MVARAANILGLNTDAGMVKPARGLYPHQWSWDTAFIAIGLATFDLQGAHYDQQQLALTASFDVGDVFFTAIYAAASDHLADLAELIGSAGAAEARAHAHNARVAVHRQVDPRTGLAGDVDLRTGERLATGTIGGFAPLIAGGGGPRTGPV